MNTFENLKKVIKAGKKKNNEIMAMMEILLMNKRITSEQYTELTSLITS